MDGFSLPGRVFLENPESIVNCPGGTAHAVGGPAGSRVRGLWAGATDPAAVAGLGRLAWLLRRSLNEGVVAANS